MDIPERRILELLLPESLVREAEEAAQRAGLPLGEWLQVQLEEVLGSDVTRRLNEVYDNVDSRTDPVLAEMFYGSLDPEDWPQARTKTSRDAWALWQQGREFNRIEGLTPLLASWDSKTHPSQIRLRTYLDDVKKRLGQLPEKELSVHLHVDVGTSERLTRHYDLENYLTPLVFDLGARRFDLVSAEKVVGGGSWLSVGTAAPAEDGLAAWAFVDCMAGSSATSRAWKERLHDRIETVVWEAAPAGTVACTMAFRCSSRRNWASLWKPAGDAMGPILGDDPRRPYNPNDDRITEIAFHRNIDDALGNNVEVGIWWKSLAASEATH
ncbi:MAG: hypothetical protein WEB00_14135 [Dehalococcoidia bacterium]